MRFVWETKLTCRSGLALAVVAMVASLAGCGGSGEGSDSDSTSQPTDSEAASPRPVPAGDVAVIDQAVPGTGTITEAELGRAIGQASARARLPKAPQKGAPQYGQLRDAAVDELIDDVWIQGQADEMGIEVSDSDVADELESIKKSQFRSDAEYKTFLEESRFTAADAELRVRLQLLSDMIQTQVSRGAPAATRQKSFEKFVRSYGEKWKSRTSCAPEYVMERCGNQPPG